MRTWTAVSPSTLALSPDLALLLAPVRLADAGSTKNEFVGRAEGVVLDDDGTVVAFVIRLAPQLAAGSPRTLVPTSAITITDDSVLVLAWAENKLLAQQRLDADLQQRSGVAAAGESALTGASGQAAAGEGMIDVNETLKEGVEGSAIGAVVGGILGGIAGGPLLGFALAAFFGTGGGLVGFISGGGQETRVKALDDVPAKPAPALRSPAIARLEERLHDPLLASSGVLHTTRFSPLPAVEPPPVKQASAARAP